MQCFTWQDDSDAHMEPIQQVPITVYHTQQVTTNFWLYIDRPDIIESSSSGVHYQKFTDVKVDHMTCHLVLCLLIFSAISRRFLAEKSL